MEHRFFSLCASAISFVLSILGVYFLISALVTFRTPDFILASSNDFSNLGTCTERVTEDQIRRYEFDVPSAETCANDFNKLGVDEDTDQNLLPNKYANALAASVHGLWYASQQSSGDDNIVRVAKIVVTATIGAKLSPSTWTKNLIAKKLEKIAVNETYTALKKIVDYPKTCQLLYPTASIPSPSEDLTPFVNKPPVRCQFTGDAYTTPTNLCGGAITADCTDSLAPIDDITTSAVQDLLLKHCVMQFSYARTGNAPGSFHLPVVHSDSRAPGPLFAPYPEIAGWNSTSSSIAGEWPYSARIAQGLRFGWSVWAYVPTMLGLGYLAIDSLILFIAELTRPGLIIAEDAFKESSSTAAQVDAAVMYVTFELQRRVASTFSIATFVVALISWAVFVGAPWAFGTAMPRPICDEGEGEYWWTAYPFLGDSYGGWRLDWDATFLELVVLAIMLVSIFMEIVVRYVNDAATKKDANGGLTESRSCSRNTGCWILLIVIAGVVLLVGQAAVGARFGYAWAEGVASQYQDKGYTSNQFNPSTLATTIYHQTMASFAVSSVIGMILAGAIGRWLFPGTTRDSYFVFLVWLLIVVGSFTPLIIVYGINTWFEEDTQIKDCQIFKDANGGEGIPYVQELCYWRWITFLVGVGLLTLPVVGITVVGCVTLAPSIFTTAVRGPTPELPMGDTGSSFGQIKFSTDTPFYNWKRDVNPEEHEQKQRLIHDSRRTGTGMQM